MNEAFMDILSDNHRLEVCTVVLLDPSHGAAPTIRRISAEHFFIRLHTVLGWPEETTDRLRSELEKHGKALNESLGSPSVEQLRRLGFEGVDSTAVTS